MNKSVKCIKMLNSNDSGVYDVAVAEGYQIHEIIDFLGKKFSFEKKSYRNSYFSCRKK